MNNMELIEEYKGLRILKDKETGFFKVGVIGGDISDITLLKKLINIKLKKINTSKYK